MARGSTVKSSAPSGSPVRETIVRPLGLFTTPNKYGAYPDGACSVASNVVMRAPGRFTSSPDGSAPVVTGASSDSIVKLMPLDGGHIYSFNVTAGDVWTVKENANTAPLPTSIGTTTLFKSGRLFPVRARDRMLVNALRGELVGDKMSPTNSTERSLRYAGMPQPRVFLISAPNATAGIPPQITVGYRLVFVREFSDGYKIRSVPSAPFYFHNDSGANNVTISLFVDLGSNTVGGLVAGDFVEVYRTDGLSTSVVGGVDPGAVFKLILKYTLTSGDLASTFVSLPDKAILSSPLYTTTGAELYTNPGQEGELQSNRQPDVCGASAVYKGYTFYGNITERPQVVISCPGGFWNETDMANATRRTLGVGARSGAGTIASGSAVITAVSATDILGIRQGQKWDFSIATNFPNGTTVSSVGANSITMSANATANGTTFHVFDVLELNNVVYNVRNVGDLEFDLSDASVEITANQAVSSGAVSNASGATLVLEPLRPCGTNPSAAITMTARATNGANYNPPLPEITATAQTFSQVNTPNLIRWSKISEPEHVPSSNEDEVGAGIIICLVATKDALWIFCTDGLYRLSGDAGRWRVDPVDQKCVPCSPYAACQLQDQVYAQTNYGFVRITDAGVTLISATRVSDIFSPTPYSETYRIIVAPNVNEGEVLVVVQGTAFYVYATRYDVFTSINLLTGAYVATAIAFEDSPASGLGTPVIGMSGSGVVPQFIEWNSATSFLAPAIVFQPLDDEDPMAMKQWVDMTVLFSAADAGKTVTGITLGGPQTAGGVSQGGCPLTVNQIGGDARGTVMASRQFAIAPTIAPGWFISGALSTVTTFLGMSLRYTPLTLQQQYRK